VLSSFPSLGGDGNGEGGGKSLKSKCDGGGGSWRLVLYGLVLGLDQCFSEGPVLLACMGFGFESMLPLLLPPLLNPAL